jgi:hypothetical protein
MRSRTAHSALCGAFCTPPLPEPFPHFSPAFYANTANIANGVRVPDLRASKKPALILPWHKH